MYAAILAGGKGTRLWPMSRELLPKQYLELGENESSLFQEAVNRIRDIVPEEHLLVVTHREQEEEIRRQLRAIGVEKAVLLLEPLGRNTAPAIGLAAWYLLKKEGPGSIMTVLPADHLIPSREKFTALLAQAEQSAAAYGLVTFGIRPGYPETGYGYICCGERLNPWTWKVERFVEKPDPQQAGKYLKDPRFLWNSGIFLFKTGALVDEYRRYLPATAAALDRVDYTTFSGLEENYRVMDEISIDYGILEKSEKVTVVPADIVWSDVGSWEAFYKISPHDEQGNCLKGRVIALDTCDSLVLSDSRLVGVIGVEKLIVIDTRDALLICARDKAQEVKKVVEVLKKEDAPEYRYPPGTRP